MGGWGALWDCVGACDALGCVVGRLGRFGGRVGGCGAPHYHCHYHYYYYHHYYHHFYLYHNINFLASRIPPGQGW